MRSRNRFALVVALAATTLSAMLPAGASAATSTTSSTQCGPDRDTGTRTCITSSNTYPNTVGWFGYVAPRSPCNGEPFRGYWGEGVAGICMMSYVDAWAWKNGGWVKTGLSEGTKGYVHPYAAGWRWLYVKDQGWVAIQSSQLSLLWQP
jgi:hypothetical protein